MADTVMEPVQTAAVHPGIQAQAVEPAVVLAEEPEHLYPLQELLKERLSQLLCLQKNKMNLMVNIMKKIVKI